MRTAPEALLITGAYGTGKSLLAANLADELERRGVRYAAIDLDWLAWFDPGTVPEHGRRIFLANVRAVVTNYRSIEIPWYIFAGSVDGVAELESIAEAVGMPVRVLRLTAPLDVIEDRLRGDHRPADADVAVGQVDRRLGEAIADRTIQNTGPIGGAVTQVLDWLGWA